MNTNGHEEVSQAHDSSPIGAKQAGVTALRTRFSVRCEGETSRLQEIFDFLSPGLRPSPKGHFFPWFLDLALLSDDLSGLLIISEIDLSSGRLEFSGETWSGGLYGLARRLVKRWTNLTIWLSKLENTSHTMGMRVEVWRYQADECRPWHSYYVTRHDDDGFDVGWNVRTIMQDGFERDATDVQIVVPRLHLGGLALDMTAKVPRELETIRVALHDPVN